MTSTVRTDIARPGFTLRQYGICLAGVVWREAFHVPPPPVDDPSLESWTPEIARRRKYLLERVDKGEFRTVREAKIQVDLK